MRLLELTVRNYRVHRALTIQFDAHRNVIAGPNEAGKSTLMEAIQRVLFLPAKGNTVLHRAMQPAQGGGFPEVELRFEAGGAQYHLEKRYAKANGRARLTQLGGRSFSDQAAEDVLQSLLGESAGKPEAGWAHVFVAQGRSGQDPIEIANLYRQDLVAQFQASGGAIVQQSARDAAVSATLAQQVGDWFTLAGKPRAGSPLGEAETALAEASQALEEATARYEQRESASRRHGEASARIEEIVAEQAALGRELTAATERAHRIDALRDAVAEQSRELEQAERAYAQALEADTRIAEARRTLEQRQRELAPLEQAVMDAAKGLEERQRQARAAKAAWEDASAAVVAAQATLDDRMLVQELVGRREAKARVDASLARVEALEAEIVHRRTSIAALLQVTREDAEALREHEDRCLRARAVMEAISARLSVNEADRPVQVGERTLAPGDVESFAEETEIRVGEAVRLTLTPGGGTDVQAAAQSLDGLVRARDELAARIDVTSAIEAFAAADRYEGERAALAQLQARLEDAGGERLRDEARCLAETITALETRLARRCPGADGANLPADLTQAQHAVQDAEYARASAQSRETDLAARLRVAEAAVEQAREAAEAARHQARSLAEQVAAGEQTLAWLVEQYGEQDARQRTLVDLRAATEQHARRLAATQDALEGLQPELVQQDIPRLRRALDGQGAALEAVRAELHQALGALGGDGVSDPEADLLRARATFDRARERADTQRLRADALQHLHRLFSEKQQSLAEQYTRPLVEKASEYLRPVLGASTVLQLDVEGPVFKRLEIYRADRADSAFAFDALSGGTREQVAAALRLAMVEVLAADHDGCLPVVFDDAFTHSDPERIRQLQRMLDLAASRGLQVIVLTCAARDYSGFGAREILL